MKNILLCMLVTFFMTGCAITCCTPPDKDPEGELREEMQSYLVDNLKSDEFNILQFVTCDIYEDSCSTVFRDFVVENEEPILIGSEERVYFFENDEFAKKMYLEKFTLHPNESVTELKILVDVSIKNKIKNYEETKLGTYIMKVKRGEESFQMLGDRAILIKWL